MLKFSEVLENFEYPDAKMIEIEGKDVYIKQYLPASDKYSLIYVTISSLGMETKPNDVLTAEMLFDIEVVRSYSSINFDKDDNNYFKVFDVLHNKQIINKIIENIPVEEYEELQRLFNETLKAHQKYYNSIGYLVTTFMDQISGALNQAEDFDHNAYEKGMEMITKLSKDKHI